MNIDDASLVELIANRNLVRIERAATDVQALQAFPLGFSAELLAVVNVCDFRIDGLLFLRRDTMTHISVGATETFQRGLLEESGVLAEGLFSLPHPIETFFSLLASLPTRKIVILEKEALEESEFWIGRYVRSEDGSDWIHEFTGAGNWHEELTPLDLEAITCCQLESSYIRHYQRYFDTHGFPEFPGSP